MERILLKDKYFVPYIKYERLEKAIDRVAERINHDFKDFDGVPIVICVLNGSILFTGELMKRLNFPCEFSSVRLSSYEGTEFRHTIVGKTFHQREFGSRADCTVTLPPRQQALLLKQGKQPARFQLAPRDCIEVQGLGEQALVVDDQVLGRRTFGGCGLDLVNNKAGQAALRLRTGKG